LAKHGSVLEIGCGQGIDSIMLCGLMKPGSRYVGIDYSPASIESAKTNAASQSSLPVSPSYRVGNAEALDFTDGSFEAVYSMGVIHHTADPAKAIADARRVLRDGGTAYISLYRRPSLKVGAAKMLRGVQSGLDALTGSERCLYKMLRHAGSSSQTFGTMWLECFGVPYMEWYGRREIDGLFGAFSSVKIDAYGKNLGSMAPGGNAPTPFGYLWFVEATK
jgi:SAM-dependent methyltransferase